MQFDSIHECGTCRHRGSTTYPDQGKGNLRKEEIIPGLQMKSFLESSNLRFPLTVLPPTYFLTKDASSKHGVEHVTFQACWFDPQFKSSASVWPLLTTTMLAPYRTSYSLFEMKPFEYLETATMSFRNCPANNTFSFTQEDTAFRCITVTVNQNFLHSVGILVFITHM